MMVDHGPNLGELIINKEYSHRAGKRFNLLSIKGEKIVLFISMHCVRCIELLPHIQALHLPNVNVVVFVAGDRDDHEELADFFQNKIRVTMLSTEQMEQDFQVYTHPFCIVVDEQGMITNKGNVYNGEDVRKLLGRGGESKMKKLIHHLF